MSDAADDERLTDEVGGRVQRYAWAGGVLFVVALVTEAVIAVGVKASQNDSAAKIANELEAHHQRLVAIACISILYAIGFTMYLTRLHDLLREEPSQPRFLSSWVLTGGVLFVTLHGVSDIGITGLAVAAYWPRTIQAFPTPSPC